MSVILDQEYTQELAFIKQERGNGKSLNRNKSKQLDVLIESVGIPSYTEVNNVITQTLTTKMPEGNFTVIDTSSPNY